MLSFNHARPANSGEAAAMLVHQEADKATQACLTDEPEGDSVAPLVEGAFRLGQLHFFVRYTLGEYISFMWQHGGYLIRRRRIRWPASLFLRVRSTASAALHFFMLGRGRRTYEFTIDEHGIVRASGGVTLIDWEDVSAVRTYTRGFMMVLKRGTLPIPYRCLSEAQRTVMRDLAAARQELSER